MEKKQFVEKVIKAACEVCDISHIHLTSSLRTRDESDCRKMVTMILRRSKYKFTYQAIAKILNRDNHTTILSQEKKGVDLYYTDSLFRNKYREVVSLVYGSFADTLNWYNKTELKEQALDFGQKIEAIKALINEKIS